MYCACAMSALKSGKFTLFNYKLHRIIREIAEEFGQDKDVQFIFGDPIANDMAQEVRNLFVESRKLIKSRKSKNR
jgi:hypothetical protein